MGRASDQGKPAWRIGPPPPKSPVKPMTSTAPLPDAAPANWVDRHAPAPLRPWLKLGRFDRPAGIWLLMLPGWQGVALASASGHRWPDPWLLGAIFIGAALMRAAGCAYNDIVDRDYDAQVARTAARPIPSGQITVKQAWVFVVACCLISLGVLLTLGVLAVWLGVASLALVAAYPFMKRITWWPQAWLGLTFNWGALLGFAAASAAIGVYEHAQVRLPFAHHAALPVWLTHPGWLTPPALILYASGLFWTLGYDTIYAIQDLEDDALAGVKSSARRLGRRAPAAILVFYTISLILLAADGALVRMQFPFFGFLAAYAAHLLWQAMRVRTDDPALALKLFRSNGAAGLILFIAIVAGTNLWTM